MTAKKDNIYVSPDSEICVASFFLSGGTFGQFTTCPLNADSLRLIIFEHKELKNRSEITVILHRSIKHHIHPTLCHQGRVQDRTVRWLMRSDTASNASAHLAPNNRDCSSSVISGNFSIVSGSTTFSASARGNSMSTMLAAPSSPSKGAKGTGKAGTLPGEQHSPGAVSTREEGEPRGSSRVHPLSTRYPPPARSPAYLRFDYIF